MAACSGPLKALLFQADAPQLLKVANACKRIRPYSHDTAPDDVPSSIGRPKWSMSVAEHNGWFTQHFGHTRTTTRQALTRKWPPTANHSTQAKYSFTEAYILATKLVVR